MTDELSPYKKTELCNICNENLFKSFAYRSDDLEVVICQNCGMGTLESIPVDTSSFYNDSYYEKSEPELAAGYIDYDTSSEHGVLWASEIVKIVKSSGCVLDIGCANGFLLAALGDKYQKYGIEANKKAAKIAEATGIKIIGHDILDDTLLLPYTGYFDVITAIAVFEHITHFKEAIEISLKLLKPDGVLIFEVPLISDKNSNETWLTSSLEHIYYPTISGLRYLFDNELKIPMVGDELVILDYASTYVGFAVQSNSQYVEIEKIFKRILYESPSKLSLKDRRAQLLLKVIHAASHAAPGRRCGTNRR